MRRNATLKGRRVEKKKKKEKKETRRRPYHIEYAEVITERDPDIQDG